MRNSRVNKIVRLSLFLALGVVLNVIESSLPVLIPLPGVRLGIANTVGLIVLYFYGPKEFMLIGFLRVLLAGIARGGIGSISFMLSFSGWFISSLVTIIVYSFKKTSIYGLSVCSALMHGVGQILMVMVIYDVKQMVNYLPILTFSGIISGAALAFLCSLCLKRLDKVLK